ncbi:hypothetical protein [Asaia lannensis]|uniref:hypothetical protein n=1 Tax=Asaia lannensis TaxID=415421 RepID=UPI003872BD6A
MGDVDFITRGEFSELKSEVRGLALDMHTVRVEQSATNAKLDKILSKLTLRATIGWAVVTATSAAVVTVLTHIPIAHP